jgi:hypothetical protein
MMLRDIDEDLLVHSSKSSSGFKGVRLHRGRYQATCQTAPCTKNNLGTFETPEQAAQAYLQHREKEHPEASALPPPPPPVLRDIDADLLVHSGKSSTGYQGVRPHRDQYQATCDTAACRKSNLGTFGTPDISGVPAAPPTHPLSPCPDYIGVFG